MKKLLLSIGLTLAIFNLFAQKSGSITGILADSANHKTTLNYSTVSVYKVGQLKVRVSSCILNKQIKIRRYVFMVQINVMNDIKNVTD